MKLDAQALIHVLNEDWPILRAVERGSRNHEVVPTKLIKKLSGPKFFSDKGISRLAKANLIGRLQNAKYDGYRLTYGGLDYLALQAHSKTNAIRAVGNQFGVGKESDIIAVADPTGKQYVLKIHRLGRISFRTVKQNRDYLRKRNAGSSWMDLSQLAAQKEYTFMQALYNAGFPVPQPIAQNRHTVVMEMIQAKLPLISFPLTKIDREAIPDKAGLYAELMELIVRFAGVGLIHGDFNEFNIMIREEIDEEASTSTDKTTEQKLKLTPVVIDFPQMVSIDHANAEMYFDRDVNCIKKFFDSHLQFVSDEPGPFFEDGLKRLKSKTREQRLDVAVEASGFSRKEAKRLEQLLEEQEQRGENGGQEQDDDDDEVDSDEDEDNDHQQELDSPASNRADAGLEAASEKSTQHESATINDVEGTAKTFTGLKVGG